MRIIRNPKTPKPLTIQDMFSLTKSGWLEESRRIARQLLRNGDGITIEDVTKLNPLPTYLKHNIIGSVFKHPDFKPVGFTQAKHKAANGRMIRIWMLR